MKLQKQRLRPFLKMIEHFFKIVDHFDLNVLIFACDNQHFGELGTKF